MPHVAGFRTDVVRRVVDAVVADYDDTVSTMQAKARELSTRAFGGYLRSEKGQLVERIADRMIRGAWEAGGGGPGRLVIDRTRTRVPLHEPYLERILDQEVAEHIRENIGEYGFDVHVDHQVRIGGQIVLAVECKSYTENAMFKRVLADFEMLTRTVGYDFPCVLFQLESQLGGDYSALPAVPRGSTSTHTLMSHSYVHVEIMTLLEGERRVNEAIHDPQFFKTLRRDVVERYVLRFGTLLQPLM